MKCIKCDKNIAIALKAELWKLTAKELKNDWEILSRNLLFKKHKECYSD